MRKITFKIATLCCIFLFAACEQTSFTINGKLVSRIIRFDGSSDAINIFDYEYDNQNRIKNFKYEDAKAIDFFCNFNYNYSKKNKIAIEGYGTMTITDTINLNKDGTIKDNYTYENGYLKTANGGLTKHTYSWENGYIKTIFVDYRDIDGEDHYETVATFEYGINNKPCSIDLFWLPINFPVKSYFFHIGDNFFHNAGRFGKVPDRLISSISTVTTKNGIQTETSNVVYTYNTDTDGYITKVYVSTNGKPSKLLYEIEYQN